MSSGREYQSLGEADVNATSRKWDLVAGWSILSDLNGAKQMARTIHSNKITQKYRDLQEDGTWEALLVTTKDQRYGLKLDSFNVVI